MPDEYVTTNQTPLAMPGAAFAGLMEAVLDKGARFRFAAAGCSMSPFIRDGDVVTVAPLRVRTGDVVAFMSPENGKLTVHRVVHAAADGYLVKGDNAPVPDGRVSRASIIGRVVRVEHCGRQVHLGLGVERIAIAFLSRRGWLLPVVVPLWRMLRPFARRLVA